MTRIAALAAMKRATLPDMGKTTVYGMTVESMNADELRIALEWALTQMARMAPDKVGSQTFKHKRSVQ